MICFEIISFVLLNLAIETPDYYLTAPMNITIPPEDTNATFTIPIHRDFIRNEDETFCLFIDNIIPNTGNCSLFIADPRIGMIKICKGMYIRM